MVVKEQFVYSKSVGECFNPDKHHEAGLFLEEKCTPQVMTSRGYEPKLDKDERGFLLIEHLISVVIVGILSVVLLYLMQIISVYRRDYNALTQHEVNTIGLRLQNEINFATALSAGDNQLLVYFAETGDTVSFSARNNRMLRQVNGGGGEIVTYNLRSMEVQLFSDQAARLRLMSLEADVFYIYVSILSLDVSIAQVADEENVEDDGDAEE